MAKRRKHVPQHVKRSLRNETGSKCANPGCMNRRVEEHHIKEWAVYQTHDEKDMIAICPACHDAVHHGEIEIDDETLYRWKRLTRRPVRHDVLTVEPGPIATLRFGDFTITRMRPTVHVFEFSEGNKLSFYVDSDDFFLMDFASTTDKGVEIVRMRHNRLVHSTDPAVTYLRNPGHVRIEVSLSAEFIPDWVVPTLADHNQHTGTNFELTDPLVLLDIKVLAPSELQVLGFWVEDKRGILAFPEGLVVLSCFGGSSFHNATISNLNCKFVFRVDVPEMSWRNPGRH